MSILSGTTGSFSIIFVTAREGKVVPCSPQILMLCISCFRLPSAVGLSVVMHCNGFPRHDVRICTYIENLLFMSQIILLASYLHDTSDFRSKQ